MGKKQFSLVLYLFLFFINKSIAQHVYADAGMWMTFSLDKKLNDKFTASIDQEFRLKENLSQINLFYTNLGIAYKIHKKLRASFIYRWTAKNDNQIGYYTKHRIMFDILYKEKLNKKFTFAYRHRFQFENNRIFSSENGRLIESFMRGKFELDYNITKKLKAYISEELRFQMADPRNAESNFGLHRFRHALGFDYNLDSKQTIGLYYLIQNESQVYKPNELYIVGIQYAYGLGNRVRF